MCLNQTNMTSGEISKVLAKFGNSMHTFEKIFIDKMTIETMPIV
jgi:hypothetical protein